MGGNPENEQERRPVEETETQAGGPAGVDVANGRQSRSETSNDAGADAEQRADGEVASAPEEDELTRLRRETEELRDQWTRERAEFSNFRKRTIIERQRARQETISSFVGELLVALDNFDQVLNIESVSEEVKNYIVGVQMIRDSFINILQKHNIKVINPVDEAFDPNRMEALSMENRDDIEKDTVLEVYQSGYVLEYGEGNSHVIRPARVKVGKATAASPQQ